MIVIRSSGECWTQVITDGSTSKQLTQADPLFFTLLSQCSRPLTCEILYQSSTASHTEYASFTNSDKRDLIASFSTKVRDALAKKVTSEPKEIELMQWLSRTALELIGQAGLGYSFENFETDAPTSEYSSAVKDLLSVANHLLSKLPALTIVFSTCSPALVCRSHCRGLILY